VLAPHISCDGRRLAQKAGRSGLPKIAHRRSGNNCTHRSPAFFPFGIPGIGEVIDGAIQHAPQSARQFMKEELEEEENDYDQGPMTND
jgi:hypothetical protein